VQLIDSRNLSVYLPPISGTDFSFHNAAGRKFLASKIDMAKTELGGLQMMGS